MQTFFPTEEPGPRPQSQCHLYYPRRTLRPVCESIAVLWDSYRPTANMRHSPGTPLSDWVPRSSKRNAEPATSSFTVLDTRTSPAPASAATRAPMCTAIPPTSASLISHSPVCSPARISMPSDRTSSAIAHAQRTPRAGPSKAAKIPSPVVLTSRPRKRSRLRRIVA
jgi:hypothetical protein